MGLIPRLQRSPGEGIRLPILVFWPGEFHGLYRGAESQTQLRNFHFHSLIVRAEFHCFSCCSKTSHGKWLHSHFFLIRNIKVHSEWSGILCTLLSTQGNNESSNPNLLIPQIYVKISNMNKRLGVVGIDF